MLDVYDFQVFIITAITRPKEEHFKKYIFCGKKRPKEKKKAQKNGALIFSVTLPSSFSDTYMTTKMTETFWGGTAHQIFRFPAKEKLTENSINKGPRARNFQT